MTDKTFFATLAGSLGGRFLFHRTSRFQGFGSGSRRTRSLLFILFLVLFSGCATAQTRPVTEYTPAAGEKAAKTAVSMVGKPYKYRGDSPAGFDCSGLVRYSYLAAGLDVPHGTRELRNATSALGGRKMQKGDLLFFSEKRKNYSHVGIYLGNSLFVHATSTGQPVRKDSLKDPYWEKSFLEARRFSP
jgi:cell wall-associated NlpC family hydrolase